MSDEVLKVGEWVFRFVLYSVGLVCGMRFVVDRRVEFSKID
jgi:hypothetical protein